MAFTNTNPDAPWRATYLQSNPWVSTPSFAGLIGFDLRMVMGDLLHVMNLGTARHTAACVLKTILQTNSIFNGATIELRIDQASNHLKAWAKQNKYQLRMKKLSKSKLRWQSKKFPELGSSGSDCHVVMVWLEYLLVHHALDCFRDITILVWSANRCMRTLYAAEWFLTSDEKRTVSFLGSVYINTYFRLSQEAIASHTLMWKTIPKFHLLDHMVHSERYVNPKFYATWMDEDFLKKIARVVRVSSVKTAQKRVLQRWLMGIPAHLLKRKARGPHWHHASAIPVDPRWPRWKKKIKWAVLVSSCSQKKELVFVCSTISILSKITFWTAAATWKLKRLKRHTDGVLWWKSFGCFYGENSVYICI